eukprot:7091843-Lingulodinium_polyedra.AAC.1
MRVRSWFLSSSAREVDVSPGFWGKRRSTTRHSRRARSVTSRCWAWRWSSSSWSFVAMASVVEAVADRSRSA